MFKDMSRAALSVFIFSIYMILLGLTFLFYPEFMISLNSPNPPDIASRILGMIFLFWAYLFIRAALEEMKKFFMWTVHIRVMVIPFNIVFVLLGLGNPINIVFGAIDFAFAAWTFWELRKEKT